MNRDDAVPPSPPRPNAGAGTRRSLLRLGLALPASTLAACMGIDVGSVRHAGSAPPAAGEAVAAGRIRFVVDGQPMRYGLLNKPRLQVFHRGRGVLMSAPEADSEGRFRYALPPGDYGVAVIFGGMAPTDQFHALPSGAMVRVNGIVDPGLEFTLGDGRVHDLGTLVVEVESAPMRAVVDLTGERVFGRLLGIRVEDDGEAAAGRSEVLRTPMRRIVRAEGTKRIVPAPARQP